MQYISIMLASSVVCMLYGNTVKSRLGVLGGLISRGGGGVYIQGACKRNILSLQEKNKNANFNRNWNRTKQDQTLTSVLLHRVNHDFTYL